MTAPLSKDIGGQLGRIGRHWGWLLFFGILMVAAGICAVAWPGPTVVVLAVLFGIQIIVSGIIKRKLKKIQYRPHLIDGRLAGTGLRIEPW